MWKQVLAETARNFFLSTGSKMSYPGRPPIVPGIPIPPAIGIPRYMPPIMPPVMTMPPVSLMMNTHRHTNTHSIFIKCQVVTHSFSIWNHSFLQIIPSSGSLSIPQMRPYRSATATTTTGSSGSTNSSSRYNYQQIKRSVPEAGPPITVFVGNIVEHAPDMMIRQILGTCGHVISWKRIQGKNFCTINSTVTLKFHQFSLYIWFQIWLFQVLDFVNLAALNQLLELCAFSTTWMWVVKS